MDSETPLQPPYDIGDDKWCKMGKQGLGLINAFRAQETLASEACRKRIKWNDQLYQLAFQHSIAMAQSGQISHEGV